MPAKALGTSHTFFINKVGSLVYYDSLGKRRSADRQSFRMIKALAKSCQNCEVVVFQHSLLSEKIARTKLTLWENGRRKLNRRIRKSKDESLTNFYANLYNRHSRSNDQTKRTLTYFGHEIPEISALIGLPTKDNGAQLNVETLRGFLAHTLDQKKPLSLLLISACDGATPFSLAQLLPLTNLLVTSFTPINLASFDIAKLGRLSPLENSENYTDFEIANQLLEDSFHRVLDQTETGLSIYVPGLLDDPSFIDLSNKYRQDLATRDQESGLKRVDCSQVYSNVPDAKEQYLFRDHQFFPVAAQAPPTGLSCITR